MAMLSFKLVDANDKCYSVDNVLSYQLMRDTDAACDGLRLRFIQTQLMPEIKSVYAYCDNQCVFNGLVDTQREEIGDKGINAFVYARSTACLLTDNQALPFTYTYPSANSLYYHNAKGLGFTSALPQIYSNSSYQVGNGVSCYGAINSFVYGICGRHIAVDVNNCIYIPSDNSAIDLKAKSIISEKRAINRGKVISKIDYKLNGSASYCYHIKSRYFEDKSIKRSKKLNITAMPLWQQDSALINALESGARSYSTIELVINGYVSCDLYSSVQYDSRLVADTTDYYVGSLCHYADNNGEFTKIVLNKSVDLREVSYVAEQNDI